jgi:hypothetical protein
MPRELEAVDAVLAADQAVQRARRGVEEFQEIVTSALRVLDDAELDSAKSRLSDRGGFYLDAATEHLGRLQTRCEELPDVATELDTHLARAAIAVDEARDRLSEVDTRDPALAADVEQLQPRVAILHEVVNLARLIAHLASDHVESAREASREVTAPGLREPQTLERNLRAAGSQLDRAHEDVRLLETVVERAASQAHESVGIATEICDNARKRMDAHRDDPGGHSPGHGPGHGHGLGATAPAAGGLSR